MTKKFSSFGDDGKRMNDWKDYLSGDKVDGWYGLVKEEYKKLLLESNSHDRLDEMSRELFGEAWDWEAAKYRMNQLSNVGSDAWRKISPKARKKYEKEQQKLAKAIGSAAQNLITKELMPMINKKYPEFPNMRKKEDFVDVVLNIGVIYDSVYDAAKKDPEEKGFIDCVSANELIKNLRTIVRFYLDNKLGGAGKHFTEEQQREIARLREAPNVPFGGVAAPAQGRGRTARKLKGSQAAYTAPEGPKGLTKRGKVRDETESTTWKGLQSNMLPLLLAAGGAVSIAGATLFASDWFQNLFKTSGSPPEFGREVTSHLQDTGLTDPGSVTNHVGEMVNGQPYSPDATLDDLMNGINQFESADGSVQGLDAVSELATTGDPGAFTETFNAAITAADGSPIPGNTPLENIFGMTQGGLNPELVTQAGGPGMHANLQLKIPVMVLKMVVKSTVTKGAVTAATGALAGTAMLASAILLPLGIALITSAVAVKLIRLKGMSSSRAKLLKDLLEEMGDVKCDDEPGPVPPPPPPPSDCDEVIEELMSKYEVGMIVRYLEEYERGNITGMKPGKKGKGGETLIGPITAMPGEGKIPSIEEQQKTKEWKNEKVIFIQIGNMIPLEAGTRKSAGGTRAIGAIRDCKLNIAEPTDEEIAIAWESSPKSAATMGLPKPGDTGIADIEGDQKQQVNLEDINLALKKIERKFPNEPTIDPATLRIAKSALARLAKNLGVPQTFAMRPAKRSDDSVVSDLREADEPVSRLPIEKLIKKLVNNLTQAGPADDPEAEDVKIEEFSTTPGSDGAIRLANFIQAASLARVSFSWKGKPFSSVKYAPAADRRLALAFYKKLKTPSGPTKQKKTSDQALPLAAKENKQRKGCYNCKKKVLRESKQPDPWDEMRARWKTLSGIK